MVKSKRRNSLVGMFIGGNNSSVPQEESRKSSSKKYVKRSKARARGVPRSKSSDGIPGSERMARRASMPNTSTTVTKPSSPVSSGATAEMTEPESPNVSQRSIENGSSVQNTGGVPPSSFFMNNVNNNNTPQRRPLPTNPRVLYTRRLSEKCLVSPQEEDNADDDMPAFPQATSSTPDDRQSAKTPTSMNTDSQDDDEDSIRAFGGTQDSSIGGGTADIEHPFYGMAMSDSCLSYNADEDDEDGDTKDNDENDHGTEELNNFDNMLAYASQDDDGPARRRRLRREASPEKEPEPEQEQPPARPRPRPQLQQYKQYSNRSLLGMCGSNLSGDEGASRRVMPRRFSMGSVASMESSHNNSGNFNFDETEESGPSSTPQAVQIPVNKEGNKKVKGGEAEEPNFEVIMTIVASWEAVKQFDDYEEIMAEQILLRMMELDSNVRRDLKMPSLLHGRDRFKVLQDAIMSILDGFMSFLGPVPLSEFHEEMAEIGKRYKSDGFRAELLSPSVVEGLRFLLGADLTAELEKGWESVLNYLVSKMK